MATKILIFHIKLHNPKALLQMLFERIANIPRSVFEGNILLVLSLNTKEIQL